MAEVAAIVHCERAIAYESPDHLIPKGTKRDNSTNSWFNLKLYRLYGWNAYLRILDMGCSGGGFVKECIDDGHFAIGLEGSDYSKKHRRAEWRTIPEHLFTCDITGDFDIYTPDTEKRMLFDVVTSWEVIEHIAEKDLPTIAENVKKHMSKDSMWIVSIAPWDDFVNGLNLHQCVHPEAWWIEKFAKIGFIARKDYLKYFDGHFVRGSKAGTRSFNLVLTLPENELPNIPKETLLQRALSKWRGTVLQKILNLIVTGQGCRGYDDATS